MTERDTRGGVTTLRDLPQAIEPEADLWPQIEAQIAGRGSTVAAPAAAGARRRTPAASRAYLAAAAMVACVAVGAWIGRSVLPGSAPLAAAARPAPAALQVSWVPDPRYQRQHQELLRALGAQLATLPPASRAKVMASLEAIGKAKRELESALGKDPGNALLQELLVNTYQDEMRVLTDVHEASDAGEGI
ncbi:MAG TPA: hypothetical protein VH135_02030 [Steroidobacteraceae bacterium]|nr:hypothetical protein [Steroidobacteraceae bacterium]